MKQLIIIKLGGSVITDKNKSTPTARLSVLRNLAKEISKTYSTNKYQIILVHGAGSYGHPLAKKYDLHKGIKSVDQLIGISLTQQKMIELNQLIINLLLNEDLPVTTLVPHSFITQSAGKLIELDSNLIKKSLAQGQIPVLYGDVVFDEKWQCSILSGDTIISNLAKQLIADKIIFLSDVDGIFDKDPNRFTDAKIIPEISNDNLEKVLQGLTETDRDDVTGEMKGKILSIKEKLMESEVFIINGSKPQLLSEVLNKGHVGTKLLFG